MLVFRDHGLFVFQNSFKSMNVVGSLITESAFRFFENIFQIFSKPKKDHGDVCLLYYITDNGQGKRIVCVLKRGKFEKQLEFFLGS